MGLYIHSLAGIPNASRSYYIYLLDYGWHDPLADALFNNFQRMAEIASKNDAVVIRGTNDSVHFSDNVFSWHNINGEAGEKNLPAILITDRHPYEFQESLFESQGNINRDDYKIILFPLKKYCKTTTDVIEYVDEIFKDVVEKNNLSDFRIVREMKKGIGRALVDGILLEPNIAGVGYNFTPLIEYFKDK